jgi:hypothetical protein
MFSRYTTKCRVPVHALFRAGRGSGLSSISQEQVLHPAALGSYDERLPDQGSMQGYTVITCTNPAALQSGRLLLGLDMGVLESPPCIREADTRE